MEERGRTAGQTKASATPTPIRLVAKEVAHVYFALWVDCEVSTKDFFVAINADIKYKKSDIIWSKASIRAGLIVVLIDNMELIQFLVDNPEVNSKYAVVSWIYGQTMTEIINAEWHIRQVTPLVITPLFSDHTPKQATALMYNRGSNPVWGPVTNVKKTGPPKGIQQQGVEHPKKESNPPPPIPQGTNGAHHPTGPNQVV
jgi:hypothetical protein